MEQDIAVLVVDDEDRFRNNLVKLLRAENIKALGARNAEEAFQALDCDCYDVVLLDVKMPGINGIEALKRIKRAGCDVEVIILTGHASVDHAVEIMQYGAFDYLLKPCPMEELLDKVSLAVERKREKRNTMGAKATRPDDKTT